MTSQSCVLFDLQNLSDKKLFELCQQYGKNSKTWRRKFESLLPEVEKRKLHKKRGFYSIYEFAAKLCGLTHDTVNEVLRVHRKLEDKPELLKQLKEQGWAKTRVVATIATLETDNMWAEKVKTLPKSSLETYVQDWKRQKAGEAISTNKPEFLPGEESQPANTHQTISFKISPETEFRLRKLKQKIEKKKKEKISFDQLMRTMLDKLEKTDNNTHENTPKITKEYSQKNRKTSTPNTTTRTINTQKRHDLEKEFKGQCGHPNCNKPATQFHHTKRFAHHKTHEYIVPLCKEHHDLSHAGLIENEQKHPSTWGIRENSEWNNTIDYKIDQKVFREKHRHR